MLEDTLKIRVLRAVYFVLGFALFPFYQAIMIWVFSCVIPILIGYVRVILKDDLDLLRELNKWENIFYFFNFRQTLLPIYMEYLALIIQVVLTALFYFGLV